jgi:tetratricopeptide (TPR) repeat protein
MAPPKDSAATATTTNQDVTSFLQRMYDPSITRGLESRMSSHHDDLFHAPWRLKTHNDDDNNNTTKAPADDNVEATRATAVYPSFTYLELRRIQNNEWATDRLKQGIRLAKEGNSVKAEACYKEGLDLVPTHAALFVAYGALCANLGRTREAIDKLQHALELDSSVPNAQTYLDAIVGKKKTPPRKAGSVMRSETAIQDALMERSFLSQESNNKDAIDKQKDGKYSLVHQENANGDDKSNERSKRKHRHKEKKRRSSHRHDDDHRSHNHHRKSRSKRKRRKRHDSDSDDDSTSNDHSNKKRRGRRHRRDSEEEERRRGHYKHHDRPSTDETSEESNRRRRRKRHRRKSHRGYYSDTSDTSKDREHRKRKRKERRRSHKHKRSSGERLTSRSEEPKA